MKKKGTHITLKADCFLPYINFDNVSYIFQEAVFLTYGILNDVSFDLFFLYLLLVMIYLFVFCIPMCNIYISQPKKCYIVRYNLQYILKQNLNLTKLKYTISKLTITCIKQVTNFIITIYFS